MSVRLACIRPILIGNRLIPKQRFGLRYSEGAAVVTDPRFAPKVWIGLPHPVSVWGLTWITIQSSQVIRS